MSLTPRFTTRHYTVEEVSARDAGPVLARYVAVASATRSCFRADPGAPVAEFEEEAGLHPVFRLIEDPRPRTVIGGGENTAARNKSL